ncbi:uncharacterized protein LOC133495761 isoform X1 [Syngnathoides biaculeatus]|uniref:uncharacterized protein LOC133495761 isoform X1 n=1 Tax=Syngnathoides biaculeatus TaxID=300417 RepID=UPI002ADD37B2|nr:uncharacterized protein LOC133495761 isoform X1 [Syngnathoides biaculeatus]
MSLITCYKSSPGLPFSTSATGTLAAVWALVPLVHAVFMGGLCFPGDVKQGESNAVLKKGVSPDDDALNVVELLDSVLKRHTPGVSPDDVSLKNVVVLLDSLDSALKRDTPAPPTSKEVFGDKGSHPEKNNQAGYNTSGKGQLNDAFSQEQQSYNMTKGQHNDFQQVQASVNQNDTKSLNQQSESFQKVQPNVKTDQNQQSEFYQVQYDSLDDSTDEGFAVNI